MKKTKDLKVIDILQKIANGEDNFKFRVRGCVYGWGNLFEVKEGTLTTHGELVSWRISDTWLNCEAKIVDNNEEESIEEAIERGEKQFREFLTRIFEDDED